MVISDMTMEKNTRILALFDVDGTLTIPRKEATAEVTKTISKLRERISIGVVGGSDIGKQLEQLGNDALSRFDFNFAENGLLAYKEGQVIGKTSIVMHLGEDKMKRLVNFILKYIADLDIPIKRGTFIECRNGMLNVSPIGRNCSHPERIEFEAYDKTHNIRKTMVETLKKEFADYNLTYSIGGQISFDVFPVGWDKTYCLRYLDQKDFDEIHFFGDKTFEGGNDYEIYNHERVIGHSVKSPEDTLRLIRELWM